MSVSDMSGVRRSAADGESGEVPERRGEGVHDLGIEVCARALLQLVERTCIVLEQGEQPRGHQRALGRERLNDTIRSFLSYARPQRQSMKHMDVRQIVTDTATLLQNSAERGESHRIGVDVPSEPVWFQADEGQIRQIVWNLATNGLRAMPDGGTLTLAARSRVQT